MQKVIMLVILLTIGVSVNSIERYKIYDHNQIVMFEVPSGMGDYFVSICLRYNVPVKYAYRLIKWESKWSSKAYNYNTNGTVDRGIMQLNSQYLEYFAVTYNNGKPVDPWQWKVAMNVGIQHLAQLRKDSGSWYSAVASYNMGLTQYRKYIKKGWKLPVRTQAYLDYVFSIEEELKHPLLLAYGNNNDRKFK